MTPIIVDLFGSILDEGVPAPTTVVAMPTFPGLLAGLSRRGLRVEGRNGGRVRITGNVLAIEEIVVAVCRWYADELRALVVARASGHDVGVCNVCGEWRFIRAADTPRCSMTFGCAGRHLARLPGREERGD
jgi:hypothetical protein